MKAPSWFKTGLITFCLVIALSIISTWLVFWYQTATPMMPTVALLAPVWGVFISFSLSDTAPPPVPVQVILTAAVAFLTALGYALLAVLWQILYKKLPSVGRYVLILLTLLLFVAAVLIPSLMILTIPAEVPVI